MSFNSFRQKSGDFYQKKLTHRAWQINLAVVFVVALIIRIVLALPALSEPTTLLRPDSMGYWNPASALAAGDGFVSAPGSVIPETGRTVGYPAWLALGMILAGNSLFFAALTGIILSASAVYPLAMAVRKLYGDVPSLCAGWLWCFSLTAIALSPLILADNLLAVIACWQFYFAVVAIKEKSLPAFSALTVAAIAGCLVKPVNLPVVLAGLPVILLAMSDCKNIFFRGLAIYIILTTALLMPYWIRNYSVCGDFDSNTANIYFHNGSAIMARATGESSELWRKKLLEQAEEEFAANPDLYSSKIEQSRWKKAQFAAMVKRYPAATVITHLPNIFNLMPDVPSLLENNHVTSGERGTMAVLRQHGFAAAVNHYLNGRWYLLILLLPLLILHMAVLIMAAIKLFCCMKNRQWRWLSVAGVLVFYYIWAPGPVISGRYLLPALPMLIALAIPGKLDLLQRKETNEIS